MCKCGHNHNQVLGMTPELRILLQQRDALQVLVNTGCTNMMDELNIINTKINKLAVTVL